MLLENTIHLGDCLELMKDIPDASVNLVLCDLPYGTTDCKWDSIIPLEGLWKAYERVICPNGAVVLTSAQPFTSQLVLSNPDLFRYDLVWDKVNRNTGYGNAKKMPLRRHETILVFYKKLPTYNPQMGTGTPYVAKRSGSKPDVYANGGLNPQDGVNLGERYPVSIVPIKADIKTEMGLHPTQKPVALFEYLIKTYTNPGDLVLDNCAGSGTTAVACKQTGRRYLCIEKDREYWLKACERVNQSNGIPDVATVATRTDTDEFSK